MLLHLSQGTIPFHFHPSHEEYRRLHDIVEPVIKFQSYVTHSAPISNMLVFHHIRWRSFDFERTFYLLIYILFPNYHFSLFYEYFYLSLFYLDLLILKTEL